MIFLWGGGTENLWGATCPPPQAPPLSYAPGCRPRNYSVNAITFESKMGYVSGEKEPKECAP